VFVCLLARAELSLASERVTSLLVQRSNQETPLKAHHFVATEMSDKECRGAFD
jgi:hypothetical protein